MIVTFSQRYVGTKPECTSSMTTAQLGGVVEAVVLKVGCTKYRLTWDHDSNIGNLYAALTWMKGRRVRFTIETRDAYKRGSRTSASGRHMRKASWEAHRDVMRALFQHDSHATIKTALATYRGAADFEAKFPSTGRKNIGSMMQPKTMPECSVR
jgi:hypothetical protein